RRCHTSSLSKSPRLWTVCAYQTAVLGHVCSTRESCKTGPLRGDSSRMETLTAKQERFEATRFFYRMAMSLSAGTCILTRRISTSGNRASRR
ncbi:hypothetical protein HDU98_005387, partial [Podochytrium sp. JEL0797]